MSVVHFTPQKVNAMQVSLTLKSRNAKTGPIPVSTTSAASCPTVCPFNTNNIGGCYADSGPLAMHWRAITQGKRGDDWQTFCDNIAALPDGQLWRHNQAGDLPGDGHAIDGHKLGALVTANFGKRGFTYTHYDPAQGDNAAYLKGCNDYGFTVNLSANNAAYADQLAALEIGPVVTVLPADQLQNTVTPAGRKIVVCPAVTRDDVSCATCQLCARSDRNVIIGFPAHGTGKKRVETVVNFYRKG